MENQPSNLKVFLMAFLGTFTALLLVGLIWVLFIIAGSRKNNDALPQPNTNPLQGTPQ